MSIRRAGLHAGRRHMAGLTGGPGTPLTIFTSVTVKAWWRADLGVTVGGSFSWADQSGNGHTLTEATHQPTLNAIDATLNNLATVGFVGASSQKLTSNLALGATATFVSVVKTTTYLNTAGIYGDQQVAGNNGSLLYLSPTSPTLNQFNGNVVNANNGATANTWTRIRDSRTNATTDYLKCGADASSTGSAAGALTCAGFGIGSNAQNVFWTGSIRELIVLSAEPTPGEFAAYDTYLIRQAPGVLI